jgi:hypothetical protein
MPIVVNTAENKIIFRPSTPGFSENGAEIDTAYVEFSYGPVVPPMEMAPEALPVYFASLASVADRDYLRIPILSHTIGQEAGGPKLTFKIATTGAYGVHRKSFSAGSRVYAVTLAASQSNDREDLFVARQHYAPEEQLEKPAMGSIMLTVHLVDPEDL